MCFCKTDSKTKILLIPTLKIQNNSGSTLDKASIKITDVINTTTATVNNSLDYPKKSKFKSINKFIVELTKFHKKQAKVTSSNCFWYEQNAKISN